MSGYSAVHESGALCRYDYVSFACWVHDDKPQAERCHQPMVYCGGNSRRKSHVGVSCDLPVTRGLPYGLSPFCELQLDSNDFLSIAPLPKKHVNALESERNFVSAQVKFRGEQFLHRDPQFIFSERECYGFLVPQSGFSPNNRMNLFSASLYRVSAQQPSPPDTIMGTARAGTQTALMPTCVS